MDKLQEAIKYLKQNETLSFHHVAVKFGISAQTLLDEWARQRGKNDISTD